MFNTVRSIVTVAGLGLMGGVTSAAIAAPLYTTASLQHLCASTYDTDVGMCAGYIMGVADDLQQQGQACLTAQIGPDVLMDNIRRGWAQKPDSQPDSALHSVRDLLLQRFPCR